MTEQQTAAMRQALREATQIATWLWQNFYKDTAPQWEVLPDICGVLSQIDNMVAGLKYSADEPVAWMWKDGTITSDPDRADGTWTPLYTSPQPNKPWVGLTDEECGQVINANFGTGLWAMAKDIEAKLREKNT